MFLLYFNISFLKSKFNLSKFYGLCFEIKLRCNYEYFPPGSNGSTINPLAPKDKYCTLVRIAWL